MSKLKELTDQLERALVNAREVAKKAEDEDRDFTVDERELVTKAMNEAKDLKAKIKTAQADVDLAAQLKALGDDIGLVDDAGEKRTASGLVVPGKATIGEAFVNSAEFKAMLAQHPGGRVNEKAHVQSSPVGFKTLVTGLSDTSAGAVVQNDFRGILDTGVFMRQLTLRDVVTTGQTDSDTVEYVRVNSFTNNAGPVAESTATATPSPADAAHGVKPESALALVKVTETVKTIAHWIPATKRALSDAGQIRTLIDSFLRYGLEEELEEQMMLGSAVGEDFRGIENTPGTQVQAFDTNLLVTARKARTKVKLIGRTNPTAYVFHPNDWQTIDLLTTTTGEFHFGGPTRLGNPTLWGLPVIECESCNEGTGWVGDWRQAVLWDREQASITVSDSHADFFIRNMVAILAEMRAAFGVLRPKAFCEVDMAAGS